MADDWQVTGKAYQAVATAVCDRVQDLMSLAYSEIARVGKQDAGPVTAGALGAVIAFMVEAERPEADIRRSFQRALDEMLPQAIAQRDGRDKIGQPQGEA